MKYLLAGVAFIVAGGLIRQIYRLRNRLSHAEILLREAHEAIGRLEEQVDRDIFVLKRELARRNGETIFGPESLVRDALRWHPKAERLFTKHRRTGIIRIDWTGTETIAEACRTYDIDQEGLLRDLNALR